MRAKLTRGANFKTADMSYSDYLNTNYSSCGMDDYDAETRDQIMCDEAYELGLTFFKAGNFDEAKKHYQEALRIGRRLDWNEDELPAYK